MANLYDFLTSTGDKIKNGGNLLFDKLTNKTPQVNADGNCAPLE